MLVGWEQGKTKEHCIERHQSVSNIFIGGNNVCNFGGQVDNNNPIGALAVPVSFSHRTRGTCREECL